MSRRVVGLAARVGGATGVVVRVGVGGILVRQRWARGFGVVIGCGHDLVQCYRSWRRCCACVSRRTFTIVIARISGVERMLLVPVRLSRGPVDGRPPPRDARLIHWGGWTIIVNGVPARGARGRRIRRNGGRGGQAVSHGRVITGQDVSKCHCNVSGDEVSAAGRFTGVEYDDEGAGVCFCHRGCHCKGVCGYRIRVVDGVGGRVVMLGGGAAYHGEAPEDVDVREVLVGVAISIRQRGTRSGGMMMLSE